MNSLEINCTPLSQMKRSQTPNFRKISSSIALIIAAEFAFRIAFMNRNLEKVSTTTNKKAFLCFDIVSGPIKSAANTLNGKPVSRRAPIAVWVFIFVDLVVRHTSHCLINLKCLDSTKCSVETRMRGKYAFVLLFKYLDIIFGRYTHFPLVFESRTQFVVSIIQNLIF